MSKEIAVLAGLVLAAATLTACEREIARRSDVPAAAPPPTAADAATRGRGEQEWRTFTFDDDPIGSTPVGFTPVLSGGGAEGRWRVVEAPDAPSGERAVAQLDADRTSSRFPLLVAETLVARDVEIEVVGKPISGTRDQAIGLVWRYQDADNYYVLRANALEDNVVLYKMERGKRSDLDLKGQGRTYGLDVEVPSGKWSRLGVRARGDLFTALLDGRELFEVEDDTFPRAGRVGLWTKADSVTWFDDLAARSLDGPAAEEAAEEGRE